MSPETEPYDPELEGLLREIAADPRSSLLRVPRARTPAALLERPTAVHPTATGLTTAERHLLEVHRDELADVLRRACLMRFFSDPDRAIYLNRSRSAGQELEIDTPEQWRERARAALADARRAPAPLEGLDLLEACLRPTPREPVSITQLARASQRLQPTDVAEAYVGLDLAFGKRELEARRIMESIILNKPSPRVLSSAHETLGFCSGLYGTERDAMHSYRRAWAACQDRPHPAMAWLYFAVRAAEERQSTEASLVLDSLDGVTDSEVSTFVQAHRLQDKRGASRPSQAASVFARKLKAKVGQRSRRVLDVF